MSIIISDGLCFTDDAAVVDQGVLGFGTNDANINTYSVNGSSVVYNVAVTANGCVPVVEVIRGSIGDGKGSFTRIYLFKTRAILLLSIWLTHLPPDKMTYASSVAPD